MKEVEVKILEVNTNDIEQKLTLLGAKKTFDGEIKALLFDFDNNSIRDNKKLVRLRSLGNKHFLTTKTPVSNEKAKVEEEHEIEVSDFDKTKLILESLGLKVVESVVKHRASYLLNDVNFEFDKHLGEHSIIPEYLEIEAKDVETVYEYVSLLGLKKEQCSSMNSTEVYGYYKKKRE